MASVVFEDLLLLDDLLFLFVFEPEVEAELVIVDFDNFGVLVVDFVVQVLEEEEALGAAAAAVAASSLATFQSSHSFLISRVQSHFKCSVL